MAMKNINWFPGHMARGMKEILKTLTKVDIVIEVRDARIPISSINPNLEEVSRNHSRIIVYNKTDLADMKKLKSYKSELEKISHGSPVIFLTKEATQQSQFSLIHETATKISLLKTRDLDPLPEIRMLIVGMPNVGKSSIINTLRMSSGGKKKAAPTGAVPGITKSVGGLVTVYDSPKTYLIDTPGVLIPNIRDLEMGLKLTLTTAVKDDIVGIHEIAKFLLNTLNQSNPHLYIKKFKLSEPIEDIDELLEKIAISIGALRQGGEPDPHIAAHHFVKLFRKGKLGKFVLDELPIESSIESCN